MRAKTFLSSTSALSGLFKPSSTIARSARGPSRAARAVCGVAGLTRLRAADALYVWLAAREGLPLVTSDREVLDRAPLAGATAVVP